MCYLAEGGRSALKDIDIDSGEPTRLGSAVAPPPWYGGVADPRKTSVLPLCYHVKFGRSASKGVSINRREPPKSGSAGAPPCPLAVEV